MIESLALEASSTETLDIDRRFSGVIRLYGKAGFEKLQAAHVIVIGIGGVGSWAAEALARNAVGKITLIDLDNIAESNVNRQLHAVDGEFGKAKVTAMRERILSINPLCVVREIEDFISLQNMAEILNINCDLILDCIDDAQAKIALAEFCRDKKMTLIMAGSAGGRLDPTRIKVADLAHVTGDRLLSKVRNQLRRDHAFPKAGPYNSNRALNLKHNKKSAKFGINCVYSDEQAIKPDSICEVDSASINGLNCAGYGSSVCVTAPFGFTAAQLAIQKILL